MNKLPWIVEHEYLTQDSLYEHNTVKKGRKQKICAHCEGPIDVGSSHEVYKIDDDDYGTCAVHTACHENFLRSLPGPQRDRYLEQYQQQLAQEDNVNLPAWLHQ